MSAAALRILLQPLVLLSLLLHGLEVGATSTEAPSELRELLKREASAAKSFSDRFAAEVWLVDMDARLSRYIDDRAQRLALLRKIHAEASRHELSPELVLSVIHVESLFDRFAISSAGAQGLMQVMPFWKEEIGRPEDNLTDIATNLRYGCTILKYYLERESGNLVRALARYNGSLGQTWYPERVMNAYTRYWFVKY